MSRSNAALRLRDAGFFLAFFLSGFSALVYQTIWQRLLTLFGGSDVQSVTVIVAAFMAGLGAGSWAGGHLADRLAVRARFLAFALAESGIAAFALISVPLYHGFLYGWLGERALPAPIVALVLFLTLLWPTFLMGLSLPLLGKALTASSHAAGRRLGALYGWNTLGAAAGSLTGLLVLARLYGFQTALGVGAALNLVCAGIAVVLGRDDEPALAAGPTVEAKRDTGTAPEAFPFRTWVLVYAVSGFVALSFEILWFRILGVMLKSSSFTFGVLLFVYLSGIGLGALLGGGVAGRIRRPARVFFLLQAGIPVYAAVSLGALIWGLDAHLPVLDAVRQHLGRPNGLKFSHHIPTLIQYLASLGRVTLEVRDVALSFLQIYGLLPAFLVLVPTLLMGMSFPLLQQAVQTDRAFLGRRLGVLQAANIAGSTLGAILTGLVLLRWIGSAATLRLLVVVGSGFLWLALAGRPRIARAAATVGVVALALWSTPDAGSLWARLHDARADEVTFAEDGAGVSVLKEEPRSEQVRVFVNGQAHSSLPWGGSTPCWGALPVLVHPAPRTVAAIGLGSGDTLFALASREEVRRIDCIEIMQSQWQTLLALRASGRFDGLNALVQEPRIRLAFGDGRAFLLRETRRFDVIEADALFPDSAYSGNLYSWEYFDLVRRRLAPGGLAVTWEPTTRVGRTFVKVFPYVKEFENILVGSNQPILIDRETVRARARSEFTTQHFRRAGIDIESTLAGILGQTPRAYGPRFDRASLDDLNTDLHPRDEFLTSAQFWRSTAAVP